MYNLKNLLCNKRSLIIFALLFAFHVKCTCEVQSVDEVIKFSKGTEVATTWFSYKNQLESAPDPLAYFKEETARLRVEADYDRVLSGKGNRGTIGSDNIHDLRRSELFLLCYANFLRELTEDEKKHILLENFWKYMQESVLNDFPKLNEFNATVYLDAIFNSVFVYGFPEVIPDKNAIKVLGILLDPNAQDAEKKLSSFLYKTPWLMCVSSEQEAFIKEKLATITKVFPKLAGYISELLQKARMVKNKTNYITIKHSDFVHLYSGIDFTDESKLMAFRNGVEDQQSYVVYFYLSSDKLPDDINPFMKELLNCRGAVQRDALHRLIFICEAKECEDRKKCIDQILNFISEPKVITANGPPFITEIRDRCTDLSDCELYP